MSQQAVRLESLLGLEPVDSSFPAIDFTEAVMECADVIEELSIIEQNITAYEGAKLVKKTKSAKKKVKVATKTMKAKDAKAKKAGGKVVKITKKPAKKVAREGDTEIDGGTGPLPTTTDTQGLTDTDLDADPDADVNVTEVVEDGTPEDQVVGTEGADFIVQYEDADIVRLEAEQQVQKKNLGDGIKKLVEKIGQMIASFIKKIKDLFASDKKFIQANKAAIEAGLASDKKIKILKVKEPAATVKRMIGDVSTFIKAVGSTGVDEGYVLGINILEEGSKEKLAAAVFGGEKAEPAETTLKESGWTFADLDYFINKGDTELKAIETEWKSFSKNNKIVGGAGGADDAKKKVSSTYKAIGASFTLFNKVSSIASKVARTAGGGAAPADGGDQK